MQLPSARIAALPDDVVPARVERAADTVDASALRYAGEPARAIFPLRLPSMSETQSRVLLTTEAIVICTPLTVLLLVRELPAQILQLVQTPEPGALGIFASGLFMLAALLCLWRLIITFTVDGSAALRRISTHVWAFAALAAALALRMAIHYAPTAVAQRSWLNEFAWGLPFVVPLLHVCLERWMRAEHQPIASQRRASVP